MVDGARLESVCTVKRTGGSNPPPSELILDLIFHYNLPARYNGTQQIFSLVI